MWYMLYCPEVSEERLIDFIKENISKDAVENAFLFTYERMRKYEGDWHMETVNMFPQCIFLESSDGRRLSKVFEYYRNAKDSILQTDDTLIPLQKSSQVLLEALGGAQHHLPMSRGVIRQGKTFVTEGPLQGWERMICRIDRHKRLAFLNHLPDLKNNSMKAGLEITEKTG